MFPTVLRLIRNNHGAAMVEALICLPVFVAALAGVVALHGTYITKLEAKARARRITWLQADSGQCPTQSCRSGQCGRAEAEIRARGLDQPLNVDASRFSLDSFLGNLGRYLFGKVTTGVGTAKAATTPLIGPGHTSQSGMMTLLCNNTPRHTEAGESVLAHACRTGLGTTEYASAVCK